ncbi:hypothetical protein YC2023_024964 [Brassica napus]
MLEGVTINKIPSTRNNRKRTRKDTGFVKETLSYSSRFLNWLAVTKKKRQDLLLTQRESIYGSKPSPRRSSSFRKPVVTSSTMGTVPCLPRHVEARSEKQRLTFF